MALRSPKKAVPSYPRLAELRARPVLAGLGAAVLGAAALAGCGFDPVEELGRHLPVAATTQAATDAGALPILLPFVVIPEPPDSGPDASEFMMGDIASPNPDGGQW